eukprot:g13362.t1
MRLPRTLAGTHTFAAGLTSGHRRGRLGSRRALAIDVDMSPLTQMCIASVVALAAAGKVGRWIVRKFNHQNDQDKPITGASLAIDDYDPESGNEPIAESMEYHVESGPGNRVSMEDDIEPGGAMRTTSCSLHEEGAQAPAKTSEKSASVLTMGDSSADDVAQPRSIITMDSTVSDVIVFFSASSVCTGSSIPNDSTRSYRTWSTNHDRNGASSYHGSLGLTAAAATGAASLYSNQSGRRSSEGCCGGGSGTGGNNDGENGGEDGNCVDHDVLMSALRGEGINVDEVAGGQEAMLHGDRGHSSPVKIAADDDELSAGGHDGETVSTASLKVCQFDEEEKAGEEDGDVDWYALVDGSSPGLTGSMGSIPGLVGHNEPGLATERRDELVRILASQWDTQTAVRDIHLSRHCDLDLSTRDANDDIQRDGIIGAGYYGRVSRVQHQPSGLMMALKELTEDASDKHRFAAGNEIDTLLCLGSRKNFPKILAIDSSLPSMPILMELGYCDMVDVISSANVSMANKLGILHDAACGLLHIHESGKVHGDIKAGNIIVTIDMADGSGTGKVADFGLTCDVGEETHARTATPGYLPVEFLWMSGEADPENDVFSFGVLMLEVLVLKQLWENNMFAHSSLLSAKDKAELQDVTEDAGAAFDLQCEVVARTLADGSFARGILRPENLQRTVPYPDTVCGWLQACLCQPRELRPDMASVVAMLKCLKDDREPPPMPMVWSAMRPVCLVVDNP